MLRALLAAVLAAFPFALCGEVLIVADEAPQMRVLAGKLHELAGLESRIVEQDAMPPDIAGFPAVIVYIHGELHAPAERTLIGYARSGGRLVLLHHSISSGKRPNHDWLPFLGVSLPEGDLSRGGYKWIDPAHWQIVNLAPGNFITSHGVKYPETTEYRRSDGASAPARYQAFALDESEVYLNHVFTGPHQVLLGLKYRDPGSGVLYMQDRAGWYRQAGKGWVLYFMAGHKASEFENPAYARILANALTAPLH